MDLNIRSFLAGVCAGSGLYAFLKWMYNKKEAKLNEKNDCLLFSPKNITWDVCFKKTAYCDILSCFMCNSRKFLAVLEETKTHLDICVYLITWEEISNIIIKLFNKGVFVRIIMDKQMSEEASRSKILVFMKRHIPIRVVSGSDMMHNKFVIIDNKKLITGSFNWTKQGLHSNYENCVIIHNKEIVRKYCEYFQDIWLSLNQIHIN